MTLTSAVETMSIRSEISSDRFDDFDAQPSRTTGIVWRKRSSRAGKFSELAAMICNVVRANVPEITVLE